MSATIVRDPLSFQHNNVAGLTRQTRRRTRTPNGFGWEEVYKGTPEAINSAFLNLPEDCEATLDEAQEPFHYLTVRYADDPSNATSTEASHTYELLGNSLQTDIYEHPKALEIPRAQIEVIQELLSAKPSEFSSEQTEWLAALDSVDNAPELYDHLRRRNGSMGFQESQFVFRVTTIISRRTQYNVLFSNLNKLYSFAQLTAEANPPSGYVLSLDAIQTQCAPASTPSGYAWKWLKGAPTVTTAPGNRIAIQVEWQLYEWSTWVYENAS